MNISGQNKIKIWNIFEKYVKDMILIVLISIIKCVCVHRGDAGEPAACLPVCPGRRCHVGRPTGRPLGAVEEDSGEVLSRRGGSSLLKNARSQISLVTGNKICVCRFVKSIFIRKSVWPRALFVFVVMLRWRMCAAGGCGRRTWCSLPSTTWRPRWGFTPTTWAWATWETWWDAGSEAVHTTNQLIIDPYWFTIITSIYQWLILGTPEGHRGTDMCFYNLRPDDPHL